MCLSFLLGVFEFSALSFVCVGFNVQRNNDCAGGMMEEWHQKLHNNTSPDDVVICQVISYTLTSANCELRAQISIIATVIPVKDLQDSQGSA